MYVCLYHRHFILRNRTFTTHTSTCMCMCSMTFDQPHVPLLSSALSVLVSDPGTGLVTEERLLVEEHLLRRRRDPTLACLLSTKDVTDAVIILRQVTST